MTPDLRATELAPPAVPAPPEAPELPLWIAGAPDHATLQQAKAAWRDATRAGLMADAHPGVGAPIGFVADWPDRVPVSLAGVDLGCGIALARTDRVWAAWRDKDRDRITDRLPRYIGTTRPGELADLDREAWLPETTADTFALLEDARYRTWLEGKALDQVGTLGGGNHFVDLLTDEEDRVWIAIHSGSRGTGAAIQHGLQARARGQGWAQRGPLGPLALPVESELGHVAGQLIEWAMAYAAQSRLAMLALVGQVLRTDPELVSNLAHNGLWRQPDGWRVRKGATPLEGNTPLFIGSSLAGPAWVAKPTDAGRTSLLATAPHGTGRVLTRHDAVGRHGRSGRISPAKLAQQVAAAGVTLIGGSPAEAPDAYRPLSVIQEAHAAHLETVALLTPRLVVMAGDDDESHD